MNIFCVNKSTLKKGLFRHVSDTCQLLSRDLFTQTLLNCSMNGFRNFISVSINCDRIKALDRFNNPNC